ncbi:T9SS type A sorting domain-containing protein [Ulvibacter antarcticus]|uniref:Putative secreted protein (Por secretion system target) n=1 Tax=Ulvibacter antarcticus TaxID=442714 RepID=A0A3L9YWK2_9FLAO|nr:T9SS type A sorting domain-containing protein [Ulvibacter antarcticus]RMA64150.1 putative secreted protein (Por secretion system target) [Ulvibacter antarcticus]
MKNLLLPVALALVSFASLAQLYVQPNGATDSYIYVKDQILYVNQAINLAENNPGTTRASIYLRDGSQLIQGAASSLNTGDGYISVYRNNGGSDAFDYTYWSSPVGNQDISGIGNKNAGILRVHDVVASSLTESNQTLTTGAYNGLTTPMTISRRWLYKYNDASGWVRLNETDGLPAGRGFTMKGLGLGTLDQIYDFRGRPHNGDVSVPIYDDGYTLAGNPYPSALDLNAVFYEPGNEEILEFQYWDEDRNVDSHFYVDNKGGYGTWVPGPEDPGGSTPGIYTQAMYLNYDNNGTASGGNTGTGFDIPRRFSPIGQGFMIWGDMGIPASSTIVMKNSHRKYVKEGLANLSIFHKGATTTTTTNDPSDAHFAAASVNEIAAEDNRLPQLRLNTFFNETHMRQLVLAFSDESTDLFDRGLDARSPMDASSEAFFPIGQDYKLPYVIQTVPFETSKDIPLTFTLDIETQVVLTAIEEVKMDRNAYLYDNTTGAHQQITDGQTASILLPAGEYSDRFYIRFRDLQTRDAIANDELKNKVIENVDFFQNNVAQQLEVGNPEAYDIQSANIFGMSGKLVYSASNIGNNTRFTFPTGNLSDGIYLVMLTTKENIAVNYKITVKN